MSGRSVVANRAMRASGMQEEVSSPRTSEYRQSRNDSARASNGAEQQDRESSTEEPLPPIPGTRRIGNRKLSQAQRRPSVLNLDDPVSFPLTSPQLRVRNLGSGAQGSPRGRIPSPRNRLLLGPAQGATHQPSPLGRNLMGGDPNYQQAWNAEAFRAKRREAQLALEIIPKYTEAMRNAGPRPEFDSIMRQSIEMHMDDEYDAAMTEIIIQRRMLRTLLAWQSAARMSRKNFEAEQRIRRPPSFCAKLELLSNQGPRLQYRPMGISRGPSAVVSVPSSASRPRNDSSITTDATRPSVADDHDISPNQSFTSGPAAATAIAVASADADVEAYASASGIDPNMLKQLYADAARAEADASKRASKRVQSSRRLGNLVSALGRVASFRAKPKDSQ